MARPRIPLDIIWQKNPGHLSRSILDELTLYATDRQFYPVQNALLRFMSQPQYNYTSHRLEDARYPKLTRNVFDYWFGRLVDEKYIEIDQPTRAIRCIRLVITEKEDVSIE